MSIKTEKTKKSNSKNSPASALEAKCQLSRQSYRIVDLTNTGTWAEWAQCSVHHDFLKFKSKKSKSRANLLRKVQKEFGKGRSRSKRCPFLWGLRAGLVEQEERELIAKISGATFQDKSGSLSVHYVNSVLDVYRKHLGRAPEETADSLFDTLLPENVERSQEVDAIKTLVLAASMRKLSRSLKADTWVAILERLIACCGRLSNSKLEHPVFVEQIKCVELPILLSSVLNEIEECRSLASDAIANFSKSMHHYLDADGAVDNAHLDSTRLLLACWTRSRIWMESSGQAFDEDVDHVQFESFVMHNIRATKFDKGLMFTDDNSDWAKGMFEIAYELCTDPVDQLACEFAIGPLRKVKGKLARTSKSSDVVFEYDEISTISEWAGLAYCQSHWLKGAAKLGVNFHQNSCQIDLSRKIGLLAGQAKIRVSKNGTDVKQASPWEVCCWHQDEDLDLLEIEADFESGCRVLRQFILSRNENFCLMAETLSTEGEPCQLELMSGYETAAGTQTMSERQNTEIYLTRENRIKSVVLPLSLPEWASSDVKDSWQVDSNGFAMTRSGMSRRLFNAVFVDVDVKRSLQPRTWRKLTVAEELQECDDDNAVGYRIKSGKGHWLFYRSLAEQGNRSLFGQNLFCEFFVGRIKKDGTVKTIVEIK